MVKIISDAEFQKEVLESEQKVLVDFYAEWCGPCKMQAPILDQVSDEIGETAKVCKINVDENREFASNYNVSSIPTMLVFSKGEPVETFVGLQNKEKLVEALS